MRVDRKGRLCGLTDSDLSAVLDPPSDPSIHEITRKKSGFTNTVLFLPNNIIVTIFSLQGHF